ncbi:Ig-like domain-containing protein [Pseudomonas sp. S2_D06]
MKKDTESRTRRKIEPKWEVLPSPIITAPTAGTVSRRFNVHAIVPSPTHTKWNLDFFRASNNQKIKRYSGGVGIGFIAFVVPDELPVEEQIYFKIQYQNVLYSHWAKSRNFKIGQVIPPTPVIAHPGTVRVPQPEIQGTNGVAGATILLCEEGVGTVLFGTATVQSDGSWKTVLAEPLWMGDPFRLTAIQKLNDVVSEWASPVLFAVLFTPLITDVTVSADGKPTISGTGGLQGARLEIWNTGGSGGVLLSTTVQSDGSWRVSAPTAWSSGNHLITARQIGTVTGGDSEWAVDKAFTV